MNMDQMKLRPYDGFAIAGFLILPWIFFTGPAMLARQSFGSAWMGILGAHVVVVLVFFIVTVLMNRHQGKDIILTACAVAGRPLGLLYGVLLTAYFCVSTGLLVRESAETFKVYGMELTPVYIIAGLIVLCAGAMNFFGGKAIVKSLGLFFIFILLGAAFTVILGLNRYNPDRLFPILGYGWPGIISSGVSTLCMIDGVIILALFAPDFADIGKMRKSGTLAIAVCAAAAAMFYLCFIMTFSAPIAANMISGFMEMGKSIYYNRFFYRFESALLFFLIFASVLTASLGLYIARKSAALTFGARKYKTLTVIPGAVILAVALIPASLFDLVNRYFAFTRQYSVFFMAGVPLFLFVISSIKRMVGYEK